MTFTRESMSKRNKMNPNTFFHQIANFAKVKLPNGFIGKITFFLIVVAVLLTILALKADVLGLYIAVVAIIAVLAFAALFKLASFANKNPHAALLEGAQLIMHERIELASKTSGLISAQNRMVDPSLNLNPIEQIEAEQPDDGVKNGGK